MVEEKTRRLGRPTEIAGTGRKQFLSVAIREPEKNVLDEWCWRLRLSRAEFMRQLILEGLKKYTEDPMATEKHPLPYPVDAP